VTRIKYDFAEKSLILTLPKPLQILGLSLRLPGAGDEAELWSLLEAGLCVVQDVSPEGRWRPERFLSRDKHARGMTYSFAGGYLRDGLAFDAAAFGISRREAEQMDPQQRLLLEVAWEALEDAGIPPSSLSGENVGVYVGASSTDYADVPLLDLAALDAHFMTGNSLAMVSNRISYCLDLKGPSLTIDTACSSSVVALAHAAAALEAGRISLAIVGGVNMLCSPAPFVGFSRAGMLSPTGRCRPFSAKGDGYVRAEGAVAIILARAGEHPGKHGPRALLRAVGVNSDGRTNGISLPSLTGQRDLLRALYREAGIGAGDLAFVEAHGTGTRVGDPIEARAIGESLGQHRDTPLPVGSIKSNIGHLEPASGMAGLAKVILSLERRRYPATLHLEEINPDIDTQRLGLAPAVEAVDLAADGPLLAGLCNYGFGGTNAHAILESAPPVVAMATPQARYLVISAHSKAALRKLAAAHVPAVASFGAQAVAQAARLTRDRLAHRLVIDLGAGGDVAEALVQTELAGRPDVSVGEGIAGKARLAFVFSGNGSQWPGMGRTAYRANARYRAAFDDIAQRIRARGGICPLETMLAEDVAARISYTSAMQPLLFTIQIALCDALAAEGLRPGLVLGHSVGEVAAACVCGALSLDQAVLLIVERSAHQEPVRGLGGMAVLACDAGRALALMAETDVTDVAIAARNAPNSTTISGPVASLNILLRAARQQRLATVTLDVAYPFHSAALEPEREAIIGALAGLVPGDSRIPMISAVTGAPVAGTALDGTYWWANIRDPILFQAAIQAALPDADLFIEIGPRPILGSIIAEVGRHAGRRAAVMASLLQGARPEDPDPVPPILLEAVVKGALLDETPQDSSLCLGERILPRMAWDRQDYIIHPTAEAYAVYGPSFGGGPLHPLIGARLTPGGPEWRHILSLDVLPYLAGHRVDGEVVVPATAFMEMVLAVGREVHGTSRLRITELDILRALTLEAGHDRELSVTWHEADRLVEIRSRARFDGHDSFALHARATILPEPGAVPLAEALPPGGSEHDQTRIYAAAQACRLGYTGAFRVALKARQAGDVTILDLLPQPAPMGSFEDIQVIDPPSYDAALHGIFLGVEQKPGRVLGELPIRMQRLSLFQPGVPIIRSVTRLVRQGPDARVFDLVLLSAAGTVVGTAQGVVMRRVLLGSWQEADRVVEVREDDWEDGTAQLGPRIAEALSTLDDQPAEGALAARTELVALARNLAAHLVFGIAGPRLDVRDPSLGGRIAPAGAVVWRALIDALCECGAMVEQEEELLLAVTPEDPAVALLAFARRHPQATTDLRLALHALEHLPGLITTGSAPAPGVELEDAVAAASLFAAPSHEALAAVIEQLLAASARRRRLRILLLEPGLAGAMTRLLPAAREGRLSVSVLAADLDATTRLLARLGALQLVRLHGPSELPFGINFDLAICAAVTPLDGGTPSPLDLLASLGDRAPPLLVAIPPHDVAIDILHAAMPDWFRFSLTPELPVGAWPYPSEAEEALASRGFAMRSQRDLGNTGPRLILASRAKRLIPAAPLRASIGLILLGKECGASWQAALPGFELKLANSAAEAAATAVLLHGSEGRAVLLAADGPALAGEDESSCLARRMLGLRGVSVALTDTGVLCRLLVTVQGEGPVSQAMIAFTRCLMNEFPALEVCLLRIRSEAALEWLGPALRRHIAEPLLERELILTAEGPRVPRAARSTEPTGIAASAAERSVLRIGPRGLDELAWGLEPRQVPRAGEVEVQVIATGLNFRDVMLGLGVLDAEILGDGLTSGSLGFEFAGRVARVAGDVEGFAPGDAVMGFGQNAFASHVTVPAAQLFHTGNNISPEAAAAIPVAFVTAWYGLIERAGLRRGETVLIPGAAGGVGLAALHVAKAHGAHVVAAAGTAEKRALLRRLGADLVVDSRAADFEDQVRAAVGGVDVVLNSVAGDAMRAAVRLVRPFGRFVELGKRDFLDNTRLGLRPFVKNISYLGADIDQLLAHDPALVRRMVGAILALFEAGRLGPIPCTVFEGRRVSDAFRLMQASAHIGKILVRPSPLGQPAAAPSGRFQPAAGVHVVLGGNGGFGLETALWLAEQGAAKVMIVSRRGETDATMAPRIARARALGTDFRVESLDVTDAAKVAAAFARWRAELGPIVGVTHCAMVLEDGMILGLTAERIMRVLRSKTDGMRAVEAAIAGDRLQYFAAYSSSTTLVGSPGQSAYVVGNAFLEGVVLGLRSRGVPAVAICWGAISDVGVIARTKGLAERLRAATGVSGVTAGQALGHLASLLADPFAAPPVSCYSVIRWSPAASKLVVLRSPYFAEVFAETGSAPEKSGEEMLDFSSLTPDQASEALTSLMREEVGRILRLPPEAVEMDRPLIDLGLDSLMALELRLGIERRTGVELPMTTMLGGRSVRDLADRMIPLLTREPSR